MIINVYIYIYFKDPILRNDSISPVPISPRFLKMVVSPGASLEPPQSRHSQRSNRSLSGPFAAANPGEVSLQSVNFLSREDDEWGKHGKRTGFIIVIIDFKCCTRSKPISNRLCMESVWIPLRSRTPWGQGDDNQRWKAYVGSSWFI